MRKGWGRGEKVLMTGYGYHLGHQDALPGRSGRMGEYKTTTLYRLHPAHTPRSTRTPISTRR